MLVNILDHQSRTMYSKEACIGSVCKKTRYVVRKVFTELTPRPIQSTIRSVRLNVHICYDLND